MPKQISRLRPRGRKYTSVRAKVLFSIAWKNLVAKKLRSLLTIFGVVIGIGAIFFLLSFGLGLQKLVTNEVIGDRSIKTIDVTSPNSKLIKLDDDTVNQIKRFSHVEKVGAQYSFPGSLQLNGAEIDSVVYGVDEPYQSMTTLNLISGRLLQAEDFNQILVNLSTIEALGIKDRKQALGQELKIIIPLQGASEKTNHIGEKFKIVGIIDSGAGTEIFMPKDIFSVAGVSTYKNVKVIANDSHNVMTVRKQIESNGLQTTSPVDTLEQINQIFKFFTIILISFGSIGMIVSILGMFNTLTISLLERTREIGLMMALGGRNSDMRKLFIFEAVLISAIGALVGIGLATVAGKIVTFFMNRFAAARGVTEKFEIFSTPLWAVAALTGFTVLVGLMVVYIPARRAQKINPIDALRRE